MNCEKCGQPMNPGGLICESCGHDHTAAVPQVELKKPENVGSGIIGAIAGALLGAASIVLIGQLTRIEPIRKAFQGLSDNFGVRFIIPELAQFGTVIGAALNQD